MNMTTLNFAISRAAGRDFTAGDEILTTALDHDGGVAPWVELALDKGLKVQIVARRTSSRSTTTTSSESSRTAPASSPSRSPRTRPARSRTRAGSAASHVRPARCRGSTPSTMRRTSRSTSPRSAATSCSARRTSSAARTSAWRTSGQSSAETWRPYKARPSSSKPLGRSFETGTLPYELLAGFSATIAYLDSLGGLAPLRDYERLLGERFLAGLPSGVQLYGPPGMAGRVPTFLLNVDGVEAETAARALAERGIGVWYADNWYCVALSDRLPEQSLRVGLIHYNTADEVDHLVDELTELAGRRAEPLSHRPAATTPAARRVRHRSRPRSSRR